MTDFNFDDIDTDTPEIGNVIGTVATEEAETAAPVVKPKKAKPVKAVKTSETRNAKVIIYITETQKAQLTKIRGAAKESAILSPVIEKFINESKDKL